ncbi:MAG: hypothetical protein CBB68_03595 [Rhodospirillaceae bacterium TMED8]|nr:D-alanyl-D-alanine carboxypeptidase [Magnetovibrio sp.]OUT51966.1 MAG: hypothetical protein CBB68_03595 [Rhodospirillaceae bacterium TMED8]|tara:strand:- start:808 stop:2097 length:1290 start_codon:yes stop_codon:yes gene_type:complete
MGAFKDNILIGYNWGFSQNYRVMRILTFAQTSLRNWTSSNSTIRIGALLMAVGYWMVAWSTTSEAKYASIVIDANSGQVLHATNADTRNYPASLTKMMTLFLVFEALDVGEWTLATKLKVSSRAERQPASRLGLRRGQTISVKNAVMALITRSANDVATVIAENLGGSERNFALMMTAKARQLKMTRTTFRNASGLPNRGQMSTARDMARLARALIHQHGRYYPYFKTKHFRYKNQNFKNHNKLLTTYEGVDGIKTGYIRAAGYNLVASAQRKGTRLVGVVFGGRDSRQRNRIMTRLLNKGFSIIDTKSKLSSLRVKKKSIPKKPALIPQLSKKIPPGGSWGVQVGAYVRYSQALNSARAAVQLVKQHLAEGSIKVVPLKTRRGTKLYRARIQGLAKRAAYAACRALKQKSRDCMELRVRGMQLAANTY